MPTEVWYLMGAWLLGATMNALMTWWAVNLALLNHDFGNEVLSRGQLLELVPIFVATLVWVTRILFIGAFTVAGGYLFSALGLPQQQARQPVLAVRHERAPAARLTLRRNAGPSRSHRMPHEALLPPTDELPPFLYGASRESEDGDEFEIVLPSSQWQVQRRAGVQ